MRDGKLDLSETMSAVKLMGDGEAGKVHLSFTEESKEHGISESSIPLSPQWLYNKPNDSKMDIRGPVFGGNPNESHTKEGWRPEVQDEKKDWRRIASENEASRRWREEERETGLLSVTRDRKKPDRRVDNVSIRGDEGKNASIDRWHDGNGRNTVHESRRDSKWSSRWGPEDKEKDPRIEKRTETEKEKDEIINEIQSIGSNRTAPERDGDSRDKWRPRHRTDVHSVSPLNNRVAPGFGVERGRTEGGNVGFVLGRGRSSTNGRSISVGSTYPGQINNTENCIGKSTISIGSFRYPRGKLLDIYRRQKHDPAYDTIPVGMEESSPITQSHVVEPLAFITPELEEEAVVLDIWKGKITSSGVMYRKGKFSEDISGIDDGESVGSKQTTELSITVDDSSMPGDVIRDYGKIDHDGVILKGEVYDYSLKKDENSITSYHSTDLNHVRPNEDQFLSEESVAAASLEIKSKLPDDSGFLYVNPMIEQSYISPLATGIDTQNKDNKAKLSLEDTYFYYIDPSGNTQGPFLGADIVLWFEEGYFGLDLPVRIANATEETPFQNLGEVLPHLKTKTELSQPLTSDLDVNSSMTNQPQPFLNITGNSLVHPRNSEPELPSQIEYTDSLNLPDNVAEDEEIIFPGRPCSAGFSSLRSSSATLSETIGKTENILPFSNKLSESAMPRNDSKLHPFGLLWSELEGSHGRQPEIPDLSVNRARKPYMPVDLSRQDSLSAVTSFHDAVAARSVSPVEPPSNRFDLAEKLMSQHHLSRNVSRFNSPLLEQHLPVQNLHHQNSASDLEHLVALHHQQQRQLQLQQQLHRQQQLQQQKILEERLQAQARQAALDQLLHSHLSDPYRMQSHADPIRANNVFEQVLLEQQLLQEIQLRSHQIAPRQEQQRDMLELLSLSQRGQLHSLEQQILQEQVQARQQLPMGLRSRMNMDEDRMIGSGWSANSNEQFHRNLPGNLRVPGDLYQLGRSTLEDQLNHIDRTYSFQDRHFQGIHDSTVPFERSLSLPGGAPGISMDAMNALAQTQGFNMQDLSRSQMGPFSQNQYATQYRDTAENRWSERNNVQQGNDWMETRLQQLHMNHDMQKDSDSKLNPENDVALWMSDGVNDDKARQLLMDLLNQKSSHQPSSSIDLKDGMLFDRRATPGQVGLPADHNIYLETGNVSSTIMESTADKAQRINEEYLDMEARKHRLRSLGSKNYFASESCDEGQGFFDETIVPHDATLSEHPSMNQMSAKLKDQDSSMPRRPPLSMSTIPQEGHSLMSEGNQAADTSSSKKDGWFRRVPSLSDSDTSEPTFIEMLKSSSKKSSVVESQPAVGSSEAFDSSQGGRGKKKGKKGRQIDPALLGFKVTSNRIMMGEIQRVED